jgi:Tol biopolymer transport system component
MDPDLVVFVRDGTLLAQHVDLVAARGVGEPFSIAGPITYIYSTGRAEFATSRTGHVAYGSRSDSSRLVWRDRQGMALKEIGTPGSYQSIRIAPDGGRLLFERFREGLGTPDVWALDLLRGGETRLTTDPASETGPILSRDGTGLIFMADRSGNPPNVFRKNLLTGLEEAIAPAGQMQSPDDVSPDGSTLAFEQRSTRGNYDILMRTLDRAGSPTVLLGSPFDEIGLRFSPDGHAAAFLSDESGRYEIYVAPFPAMAPKLLVSTEGGRAPRWNPAGRELIFLASDGRVMAVAVGTRPALTLGAARTLFTLPKGESWIDFAMSTDGERFLSISPVTRGDEQPLTLILDWPGGTTRR